MRQGTGNFQNTQGSQLEFDNAGGNHGSLFIDENIDEVE